MNSKCRAAAVAAALLFAAMPAASQGLIGKDNPSQVPLSSSFSQAAAASPPVLSVLNGILALPSNQQGYVVEQLSGRGYAGFATANVQTSLLFMNAVAGQMAAARGASSAPRLTLAEACDTACNADGPWSVWLNGLGGAGSTIGDGTVGAVTYNAFGAAAGVDYRLSAQMVAGLAIGYSHGNNWTSGIDGRGTSDSYSAMLYASWSERPLYVDALAGYAYSDQQMARNLILPGVPPMTALGRTGANTFLGQIEMGYAFVLATPAKATIVPFARLQGATINQAGFSETGAGPFGLIVAQQTTNSLRSTLGVELAGMADAVALRLRLGWAHEFADAVRPFSAAFQAAPGFGYTIFGASVPSDSAVLGLEIRRSIAPATDLYLRYDGEAGAIASSHLGTVGVRIGL
jgi:fibronectin-binding autotransporter adhesin